MKTSAVVRMLLATGLLQQVALAQPATPPGVLPPAPPPGVIPPAVPGQYAPRQGAENAAPAPVAVRLVLDAAPKFSAFTAAGIRFNHPQQDLRWSKSLQSAFPLDLTFAVKNQAAPVVSVSQFSISFRAEDLAQRGPYYPELPAAGPDTPVKGAWINGTLPSKDLPALLASFSIPAERVEIWFKNEFWKDGGPLKLTGEVPGGKVVLTLGGDLQDNTRAWLQMNINWLEEESPGGIPGEGARTPRPRVTSPAGRR